MTATAVRTPGRDAFSARFTAPLLFGSSLNPINSSMLATGLTGIGVDFDRGPADTAALVSVLYLCSAVAQPTMGKLATVFGPRRVFVSGIVILLVGGLVGAAAPAFWLLLVSRGLIGIGTSAAYPTAMALVRARADSLGVGVPGRVLGNFSIAAQVTSVIGLPLGGVLAGVFGWRALFLVNVPVALVTLVLTLRGVAHDGPLRRRGSVFAAVDVPGVVLFAGTVAGLLLFLSDLTAPRWWLLAAVGVLGVSLAARELRAASPLLDVRMLAANRPLLRTYLRQTLGALASYVGMYGVSQWLEAAAGFSASQVGLLLLPLSGASIVIARVASGHGWVRAPLVLSGVALVATGGTLLGVTSHTATIALVGVTLLFGIGNGLTSFPNQAALYTQVDQAGIAVASGLYRTFNYLGAIFSASLIGLAFGTRATDAGLHDVAWVVVGLGAAIALLAGGDRTVPVRAR